MQKSAIRSALADWHSGVFGTPVHFRAEYHHSSYLDPVYRLKHPDRLVSIPVNGAIADMGSHILSLLTAFLGNSLIVNYAESSGHYPEVPKNSEVCTTVLLEEFDFWRNRNIGCQSNHPWNR